MDIKDVSQSTLTERPSFGAQVSFSSNVDVIEFGDGHTQRAIRNFNGLSMELNLSFDQLTSTEANQIINFLESHFYGELPNYSTAGRFTTTRSLTSEQTGPYDLLLLISTDNKNDTKPGCIVCLSLMAVKTKSKNRS